MYYYFISVGIAFLTSTSINANAQTVMSKSLDTLFPGLVNYEATALQVLPITDTNSVYPGLLRCRDDISYCDPNGGATFHQITPMPTNGIASDTFDFVNRCVLVKMNQKIIQAPITINIAGVGNNTFSCAITSPNDVVEAQLVACYQRADGAHCALATACFEGTNALGRCPKDYPAAPSSTHLDFLVPGPTAPSGTIATPQTATPTCGPMPAFCSQSCNLCLRTSTPPSSNFGMADSQGESADGCYYMYRVSKPYGLHSSYTCSI